MIQITDKAKDALMSPMRYIKYKVEIYFDDTTPTDITSDIMSIDMLDETVSSTLPFGDVTYNELSIELDNMLNKYNISNATSPYAGSLVAGKKVVVTYMIEISDNVFESIPGGTYYTDDWGVSTDSNTASLICYDRLSLVGNEQVQKFKATTDIAVVDAYKMLFNSVGIKSSDYIISKDITGYIPYFWATADDFRTCLSDLSRLTKTVVYVDKLDKINIMPMTSLYETGLVLTDDSLIMSVKSEPSYNNVYSGIRIKYDIVTGTKSTSVYNSDITLAPGTNYIINELFNTNKVLDITGIKIDSKARCNVIDYSCTDSTFSIVINNNSKDTIVANLTLEGNVIQTVSNTYFMSKQADTNNILEITLPVACTQEYVEEYAFGILDMFSRYVSSVEVSMIGYPAIDVHNRLTINSSIASISSNMQIVRISNSFNNGMQTTVTLRYI